MATDYQCFGCRSNKIRKTKIELDRKTKAITTKLLMLNVRWIALNNSVVHNQEHSGCGLKAIEGLRAAQKTLEAIY